MIDGQSRYMWKSQARLSIDAQVAGVVLERIGETYEDGLTPTNVVDASRPNGAPLHDHFEWDNALAAERYREDQARYLLRMIVVLRDEPSDQEPQYVRAFVPIDTEGQERQYHHIAQVMASDVMRKQVLARAWHELEAWRKRYEEYEELAHVFAAITKKPELLSV